MNTITIFVVGVVVLGIIYKIFASNPPAKKSDHVDVGVPGGSRPSDTTDKFEI